MQKAIDKANSATEGCHESKKHFYRNFEIKTMWFV